jgi:hypothetical protein
MQKETSKNRQKRKLSIIPLYPIIFGVYPVLALAAHNITEMEPDQSYRALLVSLALAVLLYGILRLILRSWSRAALLSLLWLALFYSYGHVYLLLKNQTLFGILIGRHRYLIAVWGALAVGAAWISAKRSLRLTSLSLPLNVVCLVLVALPVFQIVQFQWGQYARSPHRVATASGSTSVAPQQPYPDIYYIIPDGYGRSDVIAEMYQIDNSAFLQALEQRGFYVADCSQSNYTFTKLSVTSSLNMNYLDALAPSFGEDDLLEWSRHNAVRQALAERGYTVVGFETGFLWTQWRDADVFISLGDKVSLINPFEDLLLKTTPVRLIMDYETARYLEKVVDLHETVSALNSESLHYERSVHNIEALKRIPETIGSPKFVFAHLTVAHPPYVFGPNGEQVPDANNEQERMTRYRDAVTYLDSQILQIVDGILANSKTPPVIIIQGDHGPSLYNEDYQHMSILNAYYLPGHMQSLYPTISPVNTFRIVFNAYFGESYPLLEDVSWFASDFFRPTFTQIPNPCTK